MNYSGLFEPIEIGDIKLCNRIAMAPMNMGYSAPMGFLSKDSLAWYAARSRGGFGLIFTECVVVNSHPWRGCDSLNPALMTDQRYYRYLSSLAQMVHEIGDAKIFIQLSPGWGRQGHAAHETPWIPAGAPSAVPMRIDYRNLNTKGWIRQYKRLVPDIDEIIANISEGELKRFEDFFDLPDEKYSAVWSKMQALVMEFLPEMKNYVMGETPRALEVEEVVEMEEQMARQAQAAIRLGFDGVEIHSPHGYLIHSFLSSRSNKRMDRYGGSIENRARFLINIIEKTRAKIGPEKPLGARFSGDECMPGGIDHEESKAFAALARDAGANFINISQGCYENPAAFAPHGEDEFVQYGPGFKEATGLPVIAPGFISPQKAEDAVAGGRIDIVSMGRQAIADPFWPAKVKSGREKDLVKCIRCNHCLMSLQEANWITCKVNPTAGKEQIFPELWRTGSTLEKKTNRFLEKVRGL